MTIERVYPMAVHRFAIVLVLALFSNAAAAASYPERPVRMIVPFSPGGGTDIIGRVLAERFTEGFARQFIVDNRPGGGAMIGANLVARSTPDGHTLLVGTSAELTISPSLYGGAPYDPVKDFVPIALLGVSPVVLVAHPKVEAKDIRDIISRAKANPGKLAIANGGTGAAPHLAGELLKSIAGVDFIMVPYKGAGPALTDVIGGQVELSFTTVASGLAHIRSNRLKPIAVIAGRRSPLLPDVPSVAEQGIANYEAVTWFGLFAPAHTRKEVVEALRAATDKALTNKAMQSRLESLGIEPGSVELGGDVLAARIRTELARWNTVVKAAGIKGE
jgi:tripartite-type tricarboxylate transporter receptor subunit TctC